MINIQSFAKAKDGTSYKAISSSGFSNSKNVTTSLDTHNIWGQPFNGTEDVSGNLYNVGSITASGNIQTEGDIIIRQLDEESQVVNDGDLTISVKDKAATFSGKDKYTFDGAIEGTDIKANGNLDVTGASTMNGVTVNGDAAFNKNIEVKGQSKLNDVSSNNITNSDTIKTKNLEVTGSAHFFELIIDKIKAAGGAVLFTPANGFKVDIVESVTDGYKLYWQADDGSGNQADNMWKVNDQAICMSFNQAKEGTNHNISNKYYWSLVTAVSDTNQPVSIKEKKYHYIVISTVTKDGTVNPEIGDTIAMLGYRGTDDKKRQSAIYISAYTSLDKGLTAPLLAQYQGINDFNLESHRKSYFDAVGAKFVGNFEVSNGQTIEDYINNKIDGAKSVAPYIGANGNWFIWDSDTKAYKDSGVKAEGKDGASGTNGTNGKDAEFYKLQPVQELAVVDKNGTLGISLMYNIKHIKGTNEFTVGASNAGYYVRFKPNTSSNYISLSLNTTAPLYTNAKFQTNYHKQGTKIEYLTVQLVSDSLVKDTRVVPVQFAASATLEITDSIKTTVQDNTTSITDLAGKVQTNTNNISTVTQKANSIESKVTSNTTTINNLSGSVTSLQSDMSDVKQTASSITSTVSSMKDEIIGENCMLGLNGQGWSNNTIYEDAGTSFHCESTDWFQSHPIADFTGDYTFSFGVWGGGIQIKILEFTQTYYDDGIYNMYVDFGLYTPCKILTTSSRVSNVTLTNYATSGTSSTWTYTNTETITLAVGDNVAVRVTNSTNSRYNSIYGTVSAINTSSKSVTVKAIALLDQPNTICTLSCPMDKKDGTDINSLHYDERLGRYWIRFKESSGASKTFVMLFRNPSTSIIGYISRLMIEESVEYPHKYNSTGQASQSMIKQTAGNIKVEVYDELNKSTGIDIKSGSITLNADKTIIKGNLNITDTKNGLTVYETAVYNNKNILIPRINLQPKEIADITAMANDTYDQYNGYINQTDNKSWSLTFGSKDIVCKKDDVVIFDRAHLTEMRSASNGPTNPPYDTTAKVVIKMQKVVNGTATDKGTREITVTKQNNHGWYLSMDDVRFPITENGTYRFVFSSVFSQVALTNYPNMTANLGVRMQKAERVMTYIGTDGMYSHSGANKCFYVNDKKTILQHGFNGIKWDNAANSFGNTAMKVVASVEGVAPNYNAVWYPFYNYTPVFKPNDYNKNIQIKNDGSNSYKYAYKIKPLTDCGICYIENAAMDGNLNRQETWILLPPSYFTGEDGKQYVLPVGYTIEVINGGFGDNGFNAYVSADVSAKYRAVFIDGHRDKNWRVSLNGSVHWEKFIYMGSYYSTDCNSNQDIWMTLGDAQ